MILKDIINDTSNRRKHFVGGILCALLLTILFAAGVATGMEYKDRRHGGIYDWKDWLATILGAVIGQAIQIAIIIILT